MLLCQSSCLSCRSRVSISFVLISILRLYEIGNSTVQSTGLQRRVESKSSKFLWAWHRNSCQRCHCESTRIVTIMGKSCPNSSCPPGNEPSWMVGRNDICSEMICKLKIEHASRVKFNFNCEVKGIQSSETDDEGSRNSVVVQDKDAGTERVSHTLFWLERTALIHPFETL